MKHVVGFSGGIDSQACAGWVLDQFPRQDVILMNSDAGGNEHPLTTEHVRWYSEHVHPVVMISPTVADMGGRAKGAVAARGLKPADPLTFGLLASLKGRAPSRTRQFCTEHLKLAPQRRELARMFRAPADRPDLWTEFVRYAGVRADESADRAKLPERQWDDYFDCELVRPLLKWTKAECFDLVKARGEAVNPLYKMGFGRVGCAPCVNSSKEDVREWAARFPEMIDKVRAWERQWGRTFFAPCVPGKAINWVDEVVEWSRTARGGRRLTLPFVEAEAAAGACVSKYGLCE